jgi:mRNA-degrading endonuclease toxin of MazEF toxin-antitoxin module
LKPKAPKKIELDQSPIKTVLKEKRGHARKLRDIPSEVLLSSKDGMKNDCAINLDHIQTVSKGKIGALITELSSTKLNQLRQALNFALGFSEEIEKS